MLFAAIAAFIGFAAGYAQGGRILRIRWAGLGHLSLLLAALGLQIWAAVLTMAGVLPQPLTIGALVTAQVGVIVWMALHLHRPGMLLLLVGLSANTLVIAVNGGMPVHPGALAAIGAAGTELSSSYYHLMTGSSRLTLLADVLPVPPLRSVISPGDVLVALGLIPLLGHLMTSSAPGLGPIERRPIGPRLAGPRIAAHDTEADPQAA